MIYHDPAYVIDSLVLDKEAVPRFLLGPTTGFYSISDTVNNIQRSFSTICAQCLFAFSNNTPSPLSNYNLANYTLFANLFQIYEHYIKYFSPSATHIDFAGDTLAMLRKYCTELYKVCMSFLKLAKALFNSNTSNAYSILEPLYTNNIVNYTSKIKAATEILVDRDLAATRQYYFGLFH